ncbi:hypothetical protein ACIBTV_27740 [Micromonospora sp. NPDC049366]|uniref:hypothetical protein n=1 Tax=Micromonospora sp. NPDC049366 TaxID=3364271 RepID=UPI0037B31A08
MSYIGFHTAEETGYVSGAERAHLDGLVQDTAAGHRRRVFGEDLPGRPSTLRRAVNWPAETLASDRFDQRTDTYIAVEPFRLRAVLPSGPTGENLFDVDLNTVIAHGAEAEQLAARISGQCEVHAFIEGKDRAWFADLVDAATALGVFRRDMSRYPQRAAYPHGWDKVAALARATDTGPIVMSYSVAEWFPNQDIAVWPESLPDPDTDPDGADAADEAWNALTDRERWERAVTGLRRKAETAWLLRISPDNLSQAAFGRETPLTWDALAEAWKGRA